MQLLSQMCLNLRGSFEKHHAPKCQTGEALKNQEAFYIASLATARRFGCSSKMSQICQACLVFVKTFTGEQ